MQRLVLLQNQIGKTYTNILVSTKGPIGQIVLNSPKNLNSLTVSMMKQISEALLELQAQNEVKVITILSNVPKAFCAGADIKEFSKDKSYSAWLSHDIFRQFYNTFQLIKKPIIVGVNAIAFGGGLQTVLMCDVIILSENAKIGLPEVNLGLIPGIGGTQRLSRLLGKNLAMKHILTGQPIEAAKIKQIGTLDVLPAENFNQQVLSIAQKIASKSITALITAKMAINASAQLPLHQGQIFQRAIFYPLMTTQGTKQGVRAFVEKRKPDFTNK